MFHKILIANRGEIACRIIRTAKKFGVQTIAVYSDVDKAALFVEMADEAYALSGTRSQETYLDIDKIIDVATKTKVDAIHPGYGFLSENAEFATRVLQENIIFIGPSPYAINAMGSKAEAKILMAKTGIPLIPGYHGNNQHADFLLAEAKKIGFPILIKAVFGGGGKGMRIVEMEKEFKEALKSCQREAQSSFGHPEVLLEKYFQTPRHVEVQIFADNHGNCVHLFERDCSLQRRHQKIIEEAPTPNLSAAMRKSLGKTAVTAAKSIQYSGAGTVEFLVENDAFYFMEMNTRLQVEHPVTEMITGIDLVEWQLRVAAGETLPLKQEDIHKKGHAVEVRIYAEDAEKQFAPAAGTITYLEEPTSLPDIRIDSGIKKGDTITPFYDPMLAKVIGFGKTRPEAIQRLSQALWQYHLVGVKNNILYLQALLNQTDFINEKLSTNFIASHNIQLPTAGEKVPQILAAALYLLKQGGEASTNMIISNDNYNPFVAYTHFRINLPAEKIYYFKNNSGTDITMRLIIHETHVTIFYQDHQYDCHDVYYNNFILSAVILDEHFKTTVIQDDNKLYLFGADFADVLEMNVPGLATMQDEETAGHIRAPMPGAITAVHTTPGKTVTAGEPLIVLEAMKMEHTLYAPFDGIVKIVAYQSGCIVQEGDELVVIVPEG